MLEDAFISKDSGIHFWSNIEGKRFTAEDLEKLSIDLSLSAKERASVEHIIAVLRRLDAHLPSARDLDLVSAEKKIAEKTATNRF